MSEGEAMNEYLEDDAMLERRVAALEAEAQEWQARAVAAERDVLDLLDSSDEESAYWQKECEKLTRELKEASRTIRELTADLNRATK